MTGIFPEKNNDEVRYYQKPTITIKPLLLVPIIIIPIIILVSYIMVHDTAVDFEHDLKRLSTCESMKEFLDNDAKKIFQFELKASVEKIYKEKNCK